MILDGHPTRILNLEDSDLDAALIEEHLRLAGIRFAIDRVWDREHFLAALKEGTYDLILADYRLPSFDGLAALELARLHAPKLPFIFVSATLGEEIAIEALKQGATDYVIKSRLGRLGACVARALRESEDRLARGVAEDESAQTRKRLSAALTVAKIGTFEWNLQDDTVLLDPRSMEILGLDGPVLRTVEELKTIIRPEDAPRARDAARSARAARTRYEVEFRIEHQRGLTRDIALVCDWFGAPGTAEERGIGVLQDITDRKAAELKQALVVRELHHRVKNSLSTVQSVINFTLKTSPDMRSFGDGISARIASLARSHALLTNDQWQGVLLREVFTSELAPYDDGSRVTMDGPSIYLPSDLAVSFAMAVHELATNAAKHGALSVRHGKVDIRWSIEREEDGDMLSIVWAESNGPPILSAPTRKGFGSTLLERLLAMQVGGSVTSELPRDGAKVVIRAPLAAAGAATPSPMGDAQTEAAG
ncbi:sensor histidine kinase [Aureimonas frigidaquae]|uniref:histidine kinase n=1 Tax=Aureimonas frigidaquae TaxID=424757 RepID=A0A0N7KXL0_9HYPH|nr:HWE histidine kinase domain-containing protein [Aureimonas frigidaquae]BAT27217.1 putative sensor histidine kinase [Aureimonas frigidaquae]